MRFHEKLNLLMSLQNIPNNKLAKALSVDPSLISRWRNGSRDLAKNSEYIKAIANYFATHSCDKPSLCEILEIPMLNNQIDSALLTDKIWCWFSNEQSPDTTIADKFISRLYQAKDMNLPSFVPEHPQSTAAGKRLSIEVYHGNEGKRQGVIRLLTAVILHKKPCTLLLYSDESIDWMIENREFTLKWGSLLAEVIRSGSKIRIIHTIDRHTDELSIAIDRWLPLYMTGAIEPYYYPNYQESLFKRTMFIAPGIAALTSSALADTGSSEQLYYHDPHMLRTLELEFQAYLGHCRPLMRIFTKEHLDEFRQLLEEFENQPGDVAIVSRAPSLATMPLSILTDLLQSESINEQSKNEITRYIKNRSSIFDTHIQENRQCEWLDLPEISCLKDKSFNYKGPIDWFITPELTFTSENYVKHIENLLNILKTHKHYHVYLSPPDIPNDILIEVKKEVGVLICKVDHPQIYIAFNHTIMVNAFQNYIDKFSGCIHTDITNKSFVIKEIETWLDRFHFPPRGNF